MRYLRCLPPSTRIVSPVMKSDSMRAMMALTISWSPPHRTERRGLLDLLHFASVHVRGGPDRTRGDRVDQDAVAGQLERPTLR